MRRTLVAAGAFGLLLGSAAVASAHNRDDDHGRGRQDTAVVVSGLDNPRQLSWVGRNLLVAEAGSGGSNGTGCTAASSSTATTTTSTTTPTTTTPTTTTPTT